MTMFRVQRILTCFALSAILLAGCSLQPPEGGGDGGVFGPGEPTGGPPPDDDPIVDPTPVARAHPTGQRRTIAADLADGAMFRLDGGDSFAPNGMLQMFAWTQIAGPPVVLDDPFSPTPEFVVPGVGVYTFELVVDDGALQSDPDRTTLRVADLDVVAFPSPGSLVTFAQQATLTLDFRYSGLLPDSLLHVQLFAAQRNAEGSVTLLAVPQDYLFPPANTPNRILQSIEAARQAEVLGLGIGTDIVRNLGFVVRAPGSAGLVSGTVRFTPQQFAAGYDEILIEVIAFQPLANDGSDGIVRFSPFTETPVLRYLVGRSS